MIPVLVMNPRERLSHRDVMAGCGRGWGKASLCFCAGRENKASGAAAFGEGRSLSLRKRVDVRLGLGWRFDAAAGRARDAKIAGGRGEGYR